MYQGPVMTDIQRSLAEQQFRHGWKEASDYHSHPNTDLKLKLREISTTLALFVSGATMKPCPQLYPSLNLHLSLRHSFSQLRSAVCHPSLSRSLHMFSISPYTDCTHIRPYLLLIHICQHISEPIKSTSSLMNICSARRQICEFIKALNVYTPL